MPHQISDIIQLFNTLFSDLENTRLVAGDDEPLYLPAHESCDYHQVIFAHGFYASAMHEIAHWCIAGAERRLQVDYGYWYEPDGRTIEQQLSFATVEARPQALEWILNQAAGRQFVISLDNLNGDVGDTLPFKRAVMAEVERYKKVGLPSRALMLQQALADFYQQDRDWQQYAFTLDAL